MLCSNILITRTDNIGDVILTMPMIDVIKEKYPTVKVSMLVRQYTADVVALFPQVDGIVIVDDLLALQSEVAIQQLREKQFDCVIHVSPNAVFAKLAKAAKIPVRIGTSHRVFHWWTCNHRVNFSKKKSDLHEAVVILKLLKPLGIDRVPSMDEVIPHPEQPMVSVERFQQWIDPLDQRFHLVIHPGSNANGREWPIAYFIDLIRSLNASMFKVFISGSAAENEKYGALFAKEVPSVANIMGQFSLGEFAQFLTKMDGLIASGTGPLHMAAALGVHTLGLFPPLKTAGPSRWQPLGKRAEYLANPIDCSGPCSNAQCACMQAISPAMVLAVVKQWQSSCSSHMRSA